MLAWFSGGSKQMSGLGQFRDVGLGFRVDSGLTVGRLGL